MAFSDVPTTHLSGYLLLTSDGSGDISGAANSTEYVLVPLATLAGLDSDEAHGTTGSWRKIVRAFVDVFYTAYNAMPTADKPTKLTVTRGSLVGSGDEVTRSWSVSATLDATVLDVADES